MKSIRTKITLCLILTVLAGLVASGSSSIALNYDSTMVTVEQMMSETAVLAAAAITPAAAVIQTTAITIMTMAAEMAAAVQAAAAPEIPAGQAQAHQKSPALPAQDSPK